MLLPSRTSNVLRLVRRLSKPFVMFLYALSRVSGSYIGVLQIMKLEAGRRLDGEYLKSSIE